MKKLLLIFAALALAVASAAADTYRFTLQEPATLNGKQLQPGNYKVQLGGDKAILKIGRTVIEAPAKLETAEHKYATTTIQLDSTSTTRTISEIHVGGTNTRIVFSSGRAAGQ